MVYDLLWWHVCHCWAMLWLAFDFDLHMEISKAHFSIVNDEVSTLKSAESRGYFKSSVRGEGAKPLSFHFICMNCCLFQQSVHITNLLCDGVLLRVSFCFIFQTGNAWITTPKNWDIFRICFVLKCWCFLQVCGYTKAGTKITL